MSNELPKNPDLFYKYLEGVERYLLPCDSIDPVYVFLSRTRLWRDFDNPQKKENAASRIADHFYTPIQLQAQAIRVRNRLCRKEPLLFEVEPGIANSSAEYQLAWSEDGTTVPFWTAWVEFNGNWRCLMTIDGESGAILQCSINPNGQALAELFPESFERSGGNLDAHFERLIAQRFCDTLGFFMGRRDGGADAVWLPEEADVVCIAFEDAPDASVAVRFRVDLLEGIWFNQP